MSKRKPLTIQAQAVQKDCTQQKKPVELLERLIKLHTKEDDIVLDCFAGSFSTADACKRLNRQCIAIELEKNIDDKGV